MVSEKKSQLKVSVGLQIIWTAMAVEIRFVIVKIIPHAIISVDLVEGDGGLGSVFHFKFGPVVNFEWQKEKILELDETTHKIALQVVAGGHLTHGFTFYKTGFKFTGIGEHETLVDIVLTYEFDSKETTMDPSQTLRVAEGFIYALEKYLRIGVADP